jgi:hypothetical protein
MGQIFQPRYRGPDRKWLVCETWTVRYWRDGKRYQEPAKTLGEAPRPLR